MARGSALTDANRQPWLEALRAKIDALVDISAPPEVLVQQIARGLGLRNRAPHPNEPLRG
jgi:hypothetical protein